MRHQPEFHRAVSRGRREAWAPAPRERRLGWPIALVLGMAAAGTVGWRVADPRGGTGAAPTSLVADRADGALPSDGMPSGVTRRGAMPSGGEHLPRRRFALCHTGGGQNCVVDGDTFWVDGEKVRIADIDAPETHPPRCAHEAELGDRATERLQALLGAAPLVLATADRDTDRYGRKLRVVMQGGVSVGERLVDEGLARPWEGRRRPWC